MEEVVQRIFAIIFATLVFFILPIYMTFEKRDDVSYTLALKITSTFVNQVKSKGYLTQEMYDEFVSELAATNNSYDIELQHISKTYNPVINVYDNKNVLVDTLEYSIYESQYTSKDLEKNGIIAKTFDGKTITYDTKNYSFELTYKLSNIIYGQEQILNYLAQVDKKSYFEMTEKEYMAINKKDMPYKPLNYKDKDGKPIYTMTVGDEFGVIIRNTNITFASILFDALTFSSSTSQVPRVYINYGATIKNEEYKAF